MATTEPPIDIVTHGNAGDSLRDYARKKVARAARAAPRPILHARVELFHGSNPSLERSAVAKATLDVSGRPVRAHVAAARMDEAIDLLVERLRRRLERLAERREDRRQERGIPTPGEWRHGDRPAERPPFFPRAAEERELIRHKTFALAEATPDEAAFDMAMLDYDFYLFREMETGEDALVCRDRDDPEAATRILAQSDAPELTIAESIERLNASGERFVFFRDRAAGHGHVLYLRYDGHYGLLAPADEADLKELPD